LFFFLQSTSAQNNIKVKYYDSSWVETPKDAAFYFKEYIKTGTNYQATTYWTGSGKLYSIAFYPDTSFTQYSGIYRKYYESGQIEDSSFYNNEGQNINSYYFYPNGKIWVRYTYDTKTGKAITDAYDINNKPIKDFIYFREAEFAGGDDEWMTFLSKNIKSKVPVKKGAPEGQYQVIIWFIVDTDGKLVNIEPETSRGFGMEEEVMRVIKRSPKWMPAIWLNNPVKAYRRQPLTFMGSEE
jgi:antitoxin component YwqK of YwqJK toxin-antitoxin module